MDLEVSGDRILDRRVAARSRVDGAEARKDLWRRHAHVGDAAGLECQVVGAEKDGAWKECSQLRHRLAGVLFNAPDGKNRIHTEVSGVAEETGEVVQLVGQLHLIDQGAAQPPELV